MINELQVHIKPSRIVRQLRPGRDAFRSMRMGDTDFFVWDLPRWERLCISHIEQALGSSDIPCWLTEVQKHVAPRVPASAAGD